MISGSTKTCRMLASFCLGLLAIAVPAFAQAQADRPDGSVVIAVLFLIAAFLYEIPAIIAFIRRHPNRWVIFALCTTLGATGIVWLGCLIWAFQAIHITNDPEGTNGGESGLNLAANDVVRVRVEHLPPPLPPRSSSTPPLLLPVQSASTDVIDRLERLKKLLDDGVIDADQFRHLRDKTLGS